MTGAPLLLALAALGFSVSPTVLLKETGGALRQVVAFHQDGTGTLDATAKVGSETVHQTLNLPDDQLLVPALPPGQTGTLVVQAGGQSLSIPWHGPRHWTLFLVPYSHVDIGFTNAQDVVRRIQLLNLSGQVDPRGNPVGALELMDQTDRWPAGSRFKFTSEVAWPVLEFLGDPNVPQDEKDTLLSRLREGRMEVGAFLINATDKFMGEEALLREATLGRERLGAYGIPVVSAMLDDVGDAGSAAQVLAAAGVRYLMFGPNSIHFGLPPLFYLDGGGGRRLLVWLTPNNSTYGEDTDLGLRPPPPPDPTLPHDPFAPLPDYTPMVSNHLEWLETNGLPLPGPARRFQYHGLQMPYPYDDYLVPYYPAHAGDNGHQDLTPSEVARDWNAQWAWPHLQVATIKEFFEDVEARWGGSIPSLDGQFSGFWGEQIFFSVVQSDPVKEARQRLMETLLGGAEGFGALGSLALPGLVPAPPRDQAAQAFEEVTLNNDHNPIPVNISGNRCPHTSSGVCFDEEQVERWRAAHQGWSEASYAFAVTSSDEVLGGLADEIGLSPGSYVVVFNPVSWERTEPVEVPGLTGPVSLIDLRTGETLPVQEADGEGTFIAPDLPPWGYAVFRVGGGSPSGSADLDAGASWIESGAYHVGLPAGMSRPGALTSLVRRADGRELADPRGPYGLNEWVLMFRAATIGNGVYLPLKGRLVEGPGYSEAHVSEVDRGSVFARALIQGTTNPAITLPSFLTGAGPLIEGMIGEPVTVPDTVQVQLEQEVRLYSGLQRVDLIDTFPDLPTQILESAIAYPLPGDPAAQASFDIPYGTVRVGGRDPYGFFDPGPGQRGDQFMTLKMNLSAANSYSAPFSWIEGIPADDVFRRWAALASGGRTIALSCRESGAVLPGHLTLLPLPDTSEVPALYSVLVGPTLVGQVLLGASVGGTLTFHCALASGLTDPVALDRFGRGFTHPPVARIVTGPRTGPLPTSGSFLRLLGSTAVVTWVKPTEDGAGTLLRVEGIKGGTVGLQLPQAPAGTRLLRVDAAEMDPSCAVALSGATHRIWLDAGELANLRTGDPKGLPACPVREAEGCGCREAGRADWPGALLFPMAFLLWVRRRDRTRRLLV